MSKVWLITGSGRGLGRNIAEAALAAGNRLIATARDPAALEPLKARYGDRVRVASLDVTDAPAALGAVQLAVEAPWIVAVAFAVHPPPESASAAPSDFATALAPPLPVLFAVASPPDTAIADAEPSFAEASALLLSPIEVPVASPPNVALALASLLSFAFAFAWLRLSTEASASLLLEAVALAMPPVEVAVQFVLSSFEDLLSVPEVELQCSVFADATPSIPDASSSRKLDATVSEATVRNLSICPNDPPGSAVQN